MFPFFIGVNEKFVNLQNVVLIEDRSTEKLSIALLTTNTGDEIELTGDDAEILFERAALFATASEAGVNTLIAAGNPQQNQ